MYVAVESSQAFLKLCGRASFACSAQFKTLVYGLRDKRCRRFLLDLSECVIMDSTFLGILARFAHTVSESESDGKVALQLLNPNERIVDLLENLGVGHLFEVRQGDPLDPQGGEVIEPGAPDKLASTRVALEAHETLMELNPANVKRFKDAALFMAEDLRRLEGEQTESADGSASS